MTEWLTLVLLSFAVSLDSFTAGFTFGLRKISISIKSIFSIGLVTAVVFLIAMLIGENLVTIFSDDVADLIGGSLFICIGIWVLYQFFRDHKKRKPKYSKPFLLKWEIKSLGIVIHVLKDPDMADLDRSGDIRGIEAVILGAALSLDAFGAGVGAAILGFSPIITAAFIATMSSLFLWSGAKSGYILSRWSWCEKIAFLPGVILIFLGFMKLT